MLFKIKDIDCVSASFHSLTSPPGRPPWRGVSGPLLWASECPAPAQGTSIRPEDPDCTDLEEIIILLINHVTLQVSHSHTFFHRRSLSSFRNFSTFSKVTSHNLACQPLTGGETSGTPTPSMVSSNPSGSLTFPQSLLDVYSSPLHLLHSDLRLLQASLDVLRRTAAVFVVLTTNLLRSRMNYLHYIHSATLSDNVFTIFQFEYMARYSLSEFLNNHEITIERHKSKLETKEKISENLHSLLLNQPNIPIRHIYRRGHGGWNKHSLSHRREWEFVRRIEAGIGNMYQQSKFSYSTTQYRLEKYKLTLTKESVLEWDLRGWGILTVHVGGSAWWRSDGRARKLRIRIQRHRDASIDTGRRRRARETNTRRAGSVWTRNNIFQHFSIVTNHIAWQMQVF